MIRGSEAHDTHGEDEKTSFIQPLPKNLGGIYFLPVAASWDSTEKMKPDLTQQCTMER